LKQPTIKLTKRYIPAVLLIAFFIISANILNTNFIESNEEYAKIINVSGKQRMLSQKLVILGINYVHSETKDAKKELVDTIVEIKNNHKYLLTKVFTQEINNIYHKQNLNKELLEYISHFEYLLKDDDEKFLIQARKSSNKILVKLNHAVQLYEQYASTQLRTIANYEFYLMLITLFVLVLEVLFIFRPASKLLDKYIGEIEAKNEQEETLIESSNSAIIAIDWTGKITTYNEKAQKMFGWSKGEMIGTRNLLNIIPNKYKKLHMQASTHFLQTGNSCGVIDTEHELEAQHKDGTIFPISISFGAKYKPKGAIVVANISDITTQKENQTRLKLLNEQLESLVEVKTKENIKQLEILQQQNKMAAMGEMIGAIAHQWRQPLNELGLSIQNLKYDFMEGAINEEFIKSYISENKKVIQFMSKTIDDFRSFFRVDKEKILFDVKEAIQDTINMQSAQLKNHEINVELDGETFEVLGFQSEFQQVILNLINNAKDEFEHRKIKNATLKIILREYSITVLDNAGGIEEEILDRIFEPYFTTKDQGKGTGMGLYMSKMIIENNMNGELYTQNQESGACFHIVFSEALETKML